MEEEEYLENLFDRLLKGGRVKIDSDRNWIKEIVGAPGVYIIWIDKEIKYVGETGNLKKRMKDLLNTYNHTFRRTIGTEFFQNEKSYFKANSKKKFSPEIEIKLNEVMFSRCEVSFLSTKIGRKELEELIQDRLFEQLLNKRKKRK